MSDPPDPTLPGPRRPATGGPDLEASRGMTSPTPSRPAGPTGAPILAAGQEVAGRFRIVRFVARGGMGEVYEAEDLELRTSVALKILRPELASEAKAVERLRQEIALARVVTHHNVCRIFDVFRHRFTDAWGVEQEITGLSMELLDGETLAERLDRRGPMSPREALPLLRQMAAALSAAHAAGVIHRDFKSGNVMLVATGPEDGAERVVVTDFGLALPHAVRGRLPEAVSEQGVVVGTADYMAPEQAQGKEVTAAADIYALGVVAFEMVTGHRPHEAETPMGTMARRIREGAPSAQALRADLDPRWEAALRRCLDRHPERRFASATAFVDALAGEPATGPFPWAPRRWWGWGLLAALLVTALAVAWALRQRGAPEPMRASGPVQVTAWPGLEIDPSFSPDGTSVAFASNRGGRFEIFVQRLGPRSRESQVTSDGGSNFQPAWSPDGSQIAYYSARQGGIWVIPAGGGTPRRVAEFGSHPAWSPDSTTLAFQSDATAELSANAAPALPPSTLWLVPARGGTPIPLTKAGTPAGGHGAPAWSPDGSRIFFTASDRRLSSVWSIRGDGTDVVGVVSEPFIAFDPAPSPDGRWLYFSAVTEGERYGVWRVPLTRSTSAPDGPPAAVLNMPGFSTRHFAIAPDGLRMVCTALATASNLWALPLDPGSLEPTSPARPLTRGSGRNNRPSFSPDGRRIAFDRWQVGSSRDIWVVAADGSGQRQLTVDPHADTEASWTPDGRRVAFLSDRTGTWSLWSVGSDGGDERMEASVEPGADAVRLSPDGTRIAYHAAAVGGAPNLWVANADGSGVRQLTFDTQLMGFPCFSPDGRVLAFEVKRGDDNHVAEIATDGSGFRQLTFAPGKSWPYSFSPDGDKVAFVRLAGGSWNVWWVSRSSGRQLQLTAYEPSTSYVRYPAWSPRGSEIVYELAETTGDLWLVEQL